MPLNITVTGTGPDMVLLHGWSMHSGIWHTFADVLATQFTLHLVDLPGHGHSEWQPGGLAMDVLVSQLAEQLPQKAIYIGWSLGGLISIALATHHPERVKQLVLLAATPKFVQSAGWPHSVEGKVFKQFADNLQADQEQALQRFLILQTRGAKHSRETIQELNTQLALAPTPHPQALVAGLDLLIKTDYRTELAALTCPIFSLLGTRDTLIPSAMLQALPEQIAGLSIDGAGHAPFISHPELCARMITDFAKPDEAQRHG